MRAKSAGQREREQWARGKPNEKARRIQVTLWIQIVRFDLILVFDSYLKHNKYKEKVITNWSNHAPLVTQASMV